jgi:hypothetical protein
MEKSSARQTRQNKKLFTKEPNGPKKVGSSEMRE